MKKVLKNVELRATCEFLEGFLKRLGSTFSREDESIVKSSLRLSILEDSVEVSAHMILKESLKEGSLEFLEHMKSSFKNKETFEFNYMLGEEPNDSNFVFNCKFPIGIKINQERQA